MNGSGLDTMESSKDTMELVEVTWAGKKLWLERSKLDEWYHAKSFEERVEYVETHPFMKQIPVHRFREIPKEPVKDLDNYVLVHWSNKALMLERDQLEDWYKRSFEEHDDFVRRHPEVAMSDN